MASDFKNTKAAFAEIKKATERPARLFHSRNDFHRCARCACTLCRLAFCANERCFRLVHATKKTAKIKNPRRGRCRVVCFVPEYNVGSAIAVLGFHSPRNLTTGSRLTHRSKRQIPGLLLRNKTFSDQDCRTKQKVRFEVYV